MSQVEKLEMEDMIREEKTRRIRDTEATRDVTDDDDEAGDMRDITRKVQGRLEQLNSTLDNEKKIFEERLKQEMEDFNRKQEAEERELTQIHLNDKSCLSAKHKQVVDNINTLQKLANHFLIIRKKLS